MNSPAAHVPDRDVAEIESLYDAGQFVAAHTWAAERHGPLAQWTGSTAALIMASRLAGNVGGERVSRSLILRARRGRRSDPDATPATHARADLFYAFRIYGRRGPLAARRFLLRPSVMAAFNAAGSDNMQADRLGLLAHVAASFRDHEAAESLWQQARRLAPDKAWIWTERASLLVAADRYPEALEAAEEALRLHPWYRPAAQEKGSILVLLGRDEEAAQMFEEVLDPAKGNQQSPGVAAQLAEIYREMRRPTELLRCLDRFESFAPLIEEPGRLWLLSRRCEARLQLGDLPGATAAAESIAPVSSLYARTAEGLRQPETAAARRVHLEVPFVRQHEKTCAPATLAALSQFWARPADHAAIAREICYGGTFDHQERHWAETHGWVAREFRGDWASSAALLDSGIPFALVTSWTNSGHLQAVIGYDARRGTVLIRDPFERNHNETLAEEFFERYQFCGPRAMALAPGDDPAAVARLEAVDLPETLAYDHLYRLRRAMHDHDRSAAQRALELLEQETPGGRLTLLAQRELASYDGDDPAALAATEGLLTLFPGEGRLRADKLHILRRLARPAEARAWLEACIAEKTHPEPNLWRELARELLPDARLRPRARQLLARALRFEPAEPDHLRTLAEWHWNEGEFAESAALTRFAACAATTREDYWQFFFAASRHLRETGPALALLEARFQRLGDQSSQPARTLFWARRERHEHLPAAAVLAEALERRPDDGDLRVFAATAEARDGEHEKAARLLASAAGKADPASLARAAAELAGLRGDLPGALTQWREVLAREPLDATAHRIVARLLAETDARGPAAARAHLDAAVRSFPHCVALHSLRVQWLQSDPGRGRPEHMAAVDALLAVQPADVWAHRERALGHAARHDLPAAFLCLDEAERLDPLAAATHLVRGRLQTVAGDLAAARASLRRALELDVDLPGALDSLLEASPTAVEKRAALDAVRAELVRQPVFGDGLLEYRAAAYPILTEAELRGQLEEALAARPDLWHAWSAVSRQHADAGRLAAAHACAAEATEKFPLLPRVWVDLADVANLLGNPAAEIAALERALRIRADYGDASRRLARAHRRGGNFAQARAELERAVAAAPLDVVNRGVLAETLWQEDRKLHGAQVLELLADAIHREPGYEWAWETLDRYARALGQPSRVEAAARLLTTTRPGEARSWFMLAQALNAGEGAKTPDACLGALDRTLQLNPRFNDAHDLRARVLVRAGRFDEALAACQLPTSVYPAGTLPVTLEARAAWVLHQRGDPVEAREKMRRVVADHPGHQWGWQMLADWAEEAKDWPEALACAERLVFLSPHAVQPLGYLADARLRLGQREGAQDTLRQAMRLDPTYLFAPNTLLRVQIEDKAWPGAEETLAFLARHHPGPMLASRTVMLAAARSEPDRACQALVELAHAWPAPSAVGGCLEEGFAAMVSAGWRAAAGEALLPALRTAGPIHPDAGAIWVKSRVAASAWRGMEKEIRRLPDGEMARRARLAYLVALGENRQKHRVPPFLRRMRAVLRADTDSWGQASYALSACGLHRRVVAWQKDWAARNDAKGWMLFNLTLALRVLGRHAEAMAVNRRALALPPDHTRLEHLAWVALEEAVTPGEPAVRTALSLSAEVRQHAKAQEQPYRYLLALTGAVLDLRSTPDATQRRALFRSMQSGLKAEKKLAGAVRAASAVRRAENRARRRMARDGGNWWVRINAALASPEMTASVRYGLPFARLAYVLCVLAGVVGSRVLLDGRHDHEVIRESAPPTALTWLRPRPTPLPFRNRLDFEPKPFRLGLPVVKETPTPGPAGSPASVR